VAVLFVMSTSSADEFVQPVISASRNLNVESLNLTSHEVTPACPVAWSVQKRRLQGGKQLGVDVIIVDNGKLQIIIVPTRGMGVLSVTMGDVRLGWDSPVKEVVNPAFINLNSRGGLGWLEGFNECIVRCGLEYCGHPGTDEFINNVGAKATMDLTLHGRIENIPASEVEIGIEKQAPYRIHVRGRVDERMFYGPKLDIQTDLSTEPGSNTFRIEDVVTNHGGMDQEFELLYHNNFGRPILEEGSTVLGAVKQITPFNSRAAEGLATYNQYAGPQLGFIEQVYNIVPLADKYGKTVVMLQNRNKDRAVSIEWAPRELPYFTVWKNTVGEKEGYVTGLEPGTNYAYNRKIERQFGRVQKLAPNATHHVSLEFAVLAGQDQVKQTADRITTIQGDQKPTVDPEPAAKE
jgi:hypothetical protein